MLVLRASHLYEQAGDGGWAAEAAVLAARAFAAVGDPRAPDVPWSARGGSSMRTSPSSCGVALAEVEAIVLWQGGDSHSAAVLLGEAIDASERTGRPVAPDLQILLCDILVEHRAVGGPAPRRPQALVPAGPAGGGRGLDLPGERYLARAAAPTM